MATTPDVRTPETALPPWKTRNLFIENDSVSPNTKIDVKADEITIEDVLVESVSVEVDKALVGVGGIDIDPGSLFTDNFNRASNSSLGANWSETGEAGNEIANDQMAGIDSNIQLVLTGTLGSSALMWGFVRWFEDMAGGGNHYAQLKFVANGINGPRNGPAVRCQGNGDSGSAYAAIYYPASSIIHLTKWNSQTFENDGTSLGSYAVTLAAGDLLKIQATGSTIKVFINGVERISATDSAVTGGRPGAVVRGPGAGAGGTSTYSTWDDWVCGDGGGGTSLKWYAIWIIAKDDGSVAGLLSESFTAPTMPAGYSKKRRVGAAKTNLATNFIRFIQTGEMVRYVASEDDWPVAEWPVSGVTPTTTWVSVSMLFFVPLTCRRFIAFLYLIAPSGGGNNIYLRPTGSGHATGHRGLSNFVAGGGVAHDQGQEVLIFLNASQSFDYRGNQTSGTFYLTINGYVDPVL